MSKPPSIYLNPLTDFGFKFLFGKEANKEFLLSFLNALIGDEDKIVDVEYVDKERVGIGPEERALIYDLHCKTQDGRKFIIEMQNRYQAHFDDCALYYLAADLYAQGEKGGWDYRLTPVYGIFMMNFDWKEKEQQHLREDICLYNMQTKKVFSNKLAMTFLKIPMMVKSEEECETTLDKWMYLFKNMEKMEAMPRSFTHEPVFRQLEKVAKLGALSKEQRAAYDASLKIYRDNYAIALTERAEGRAEGRVEGALASQLAIARNMRAKGFSDKEIIDLTSLTPAQLSSL